MTIINHSNLNVVEFLIKQTYELDLLNVTTLPESEFYITKK